LPEAVEKKERAEASEQEDICAGAVGHGKFLIDDCR